MKFFENLSKNTTNETELSDFTSKLSKKLEAEFEEILNKMQLSEDTDNIPNILMSTFFKIEWVIKSVDNPLKINVFILHWHFHFIHKSSKFF